MDSDLDEAKILAEALPRLDAKVKAADRALEEAKDQLRRFKRRRNQAIVRLHRGGMSIREIAQHLNMPAATVSSIYQTGRAKG